MTDVPNWVITLWILSNIICLGLGIEIGKHLSKQDRSQLRRHKTARKW